METGSMMERRFIEGTMPRIAKGIEELTRELSKSNELKEKLLTSKKESSRILTRESAAAIADLFEDFLESKGIDIPNDEKEGDETEAILYGSDFDQICNGVEDALKNLLLASGMKEEQIVTGVYSEELAKEPAEYISNMVIYVPTLEKILVVSEGLSGVDRSDERDGFVDYANVEVYDAPVDAEGFGHHEDGGIMLLRKLYSELYPDTIEGADKLAKDAINFVCDDTDDKQSYVVVSTRTQPM